MFAFWRFKFSLVILTLFVAVYPVTLSAKSAAKTTIKEKWREYFRWGQNKDNKEELEGTAIESDEELSPEGVVDFIDVPTTNVVDYGAFRVNFRFYSAGGVQNHLSFGVFRRLNIGATWDMEKAIGTEKLKANVPTLYSKFRVYEGGQYLPSFAIGYDGQGRFFDTTVDQYKERERGLYGVFGREVFFPGLEFYGGSNIAQFNDGIVLGFLSASFSIEQKIIVMSEYDNIRKAPDNRFNAGIRFFPTPSLGIDFAVRHILNQDQRERIVRINYISNF